VRTLLAWVRWAALAGVASVACAQDLASLPEYQPGASVSGVIRSWGSNHMGTLMRYWQEGFRRYQPDVWFEDSLKGTASAQFGLHVNVADLALSGRELFPYEYYGIYRRSQRYPVEIAVATGSFDVRSKSTALGVFVHKDNPLSKLTLKQLDGIFGDQRTGGWQKIEWVEKGVARSTKDNIRTWGALGLTGEWADTPIHVYGPPGLYPGGVSFFQTRVMGGADTWNESLQEFDDRKLMLEALGNDRYGIAYAAMGYKTAQVKALALSETAEGPFVEPTRASVANRSYPLARTAYIYFAPDRPTGDPAKVDPKIKEFLRYVLSRQGQADVEREGDYLPLTADLVREQLKKLDESSRADLERPDNLDGL
jgi:phosphate transport system substrate-binding protein